MAENDIHLEKHFERHISSQLGNGWVVSQNDKGFDSQTALYMDDYIAYFQASNPEKFDKFKREKGSNWRGILESILVKELENKGTIQVLRKGFTMAGYQTIDCMGSYPDDLRIKNAQKKYDANICRFMHQVHYQTTGRKSLDFTIFINGIPVATGEVKTELTQTVDDAVAEYKTERHPIEPGTGRKNPLLMYKRGAVVHFAISEDAVYMCTNLGPSPYKDFSPKFLPFNMGTEDGHAGNPKVDENEYKIHYFWDYILERDNWLSIFDKFVFEEVKDKQDATGRYRKVATQIFPRYHQFDSVRKMIEDVREKGAGQHYLIEHSPGSGKTETISWTAHDLTRLHGSDGKRTFSSVIIVTDRLSLDKNIKGTITQLSKVTGQVALIGRDVNGKLIADGAKKTQLYDALIEKREIIVVTIQTFLYAWANIAASDALFGSRFAVIIDEAHSSQDGDNALALRKALSVASSKERFLAAMNFSEDGSVSDEDVMNAYFAAIQNAPAETGNVSFFAFTATPKAETKTLFGTPTGRTDEKGNSINESFHLYPMRQAIEEGYIIDPLTGYIPYKTLVRLEDKIRDEKLVDERKAKCMIARWKSLHPTNVMSKTAFIIEHFMDHVAPLLDGEAKAMVVTDSRAAVVRYKHAFDAYIKDHGLDADRFSGKFNFKVPGEPLVAFSDKITGAECIHEEDEYLKDNPFALIEPEREYTEANLNPRGTGNIEKAFDQPKHRLLIVANKFQTGFDQKKLVALYVDKKLGNDVEIVQTFSRVNRTYPGKDQVFIVDFVNDPDTVLSAFKTYDTGAIMSKAQDPDVLYGIKQGLDDADVYATRDLEQYKKVLYASKNAATTSGGDCYRQVLYNAVSEPAERFNDRYSAAQNAYATWDEIYRKAQNFGDTEGAAQANMHVKEAQEEVGNLNDFKKKLERYCSVYTLVTQIKALDEPDMEVFYSFAKLLLHHIAHTSLDDIDISGLVLADWKLAEQKVDEGEATGSELQPIGEGAKLGGVSKRDTIAAVIESLNRTWGDEGNPVVMARAVNYVADKVSSDNVVTTQIQNTSNTRNAVIRSGHLLNLVRMALVSISENEFSDLAEQAMGDEQSVNSLVEQVYDLIEGDERYNIQEIVQYLKDDK